MIIELRIKSRINYSKEHLETLGEEVKDLIYDECRWVQDVTYEVKDEFPNLKTTKEDYKLFIKEETKND